MLENSVIVRNLIVRNTIYSAVLWVGSALALGACSDDAQTQTDAGVPDFSTSEAGADSGSLPPPICRKPQALGAGPFFKLATAAYKLDTLSLGNATRVSSADIDGDGYPELMLHKGGANNRDDLKSTPPKRYKFLLHNVASGSGRAFADITAASGFSAIRGGGSGRASHLAVFADVDNDGDLDAFSGTNVDPNSKTPDPGDRNEILLGDGKGKLTLASKSGIFHKEMFSTTSAAFLDYDRDGNLDIFVGYSYEIYGYLYANQDRLYKGNGDGTFTDVTQQMGMMLKRDSGWADGSNCKPTWGVAACDVDGDGDDDLITSSYGRQFNMLWRNDGAKFTEIGQTSKVAGDSNTDYKDNEFYKCYCQQNPGKCTGVAAPSIGCTGNYWNPGTDDQPWRNNGNTFTTVCGDYDNDGDMDLLHTEIRHWHIGKSSDPSQLLRNTGKTPILFERLDNAKSGLARAPSMSSWNEGDISAAFFDFDNDGLQDIILMDSDYPGTHVWLFRQKADHTFESIGKKAGMAQECGQEVTVADFDLDGDLDVVMGYTTMRSSSTGCTKAQVNIYDNVVGSEANWTRVRLTGKGKGGANRSAVGAWVKVTAGGVTQLQQVGGGYGHFGLQNDLVLHFGLGASCEVDKVEVRWPDKAGSTSSFTKVRANYLVEIQQGKDKPTYIIKK